MTHPLIYHIWKTIDNMKVNSLAQGSGFKNFVDLLLSMAFLAIFLPPIFVDLEMVGECLGVVGLFMHSLPVTAPCLLAWDSSF